MTSRELIQKIKPVPKVERPAFAGAIATVGWWAAEYFGDVSAPAAVVAASVVIIGAIVGWLAPPRG